MITTTFSPDRPFRYVRYGRMSDEQQNPRSPDQQFDEINRTKLRQGYDNWVYVKDFRDDGISGRYKRKRPSFREMLDSIRCGLLKVDVILVDTLERLGRAHEIDDIRQELRKRHGVLVLTADTGFADPTSTVGRVYGAMEAVRASSAAAQKAHDVLRGKIDTVMLKRWPGGPPPTGYKLAARTELLTRRNGKTVENVYHVLEPDPATRGIVHAIYDLAYKKGRGRTRIAKHLNGDEAFVQKYGKVSESLVGSIMSNTVYKGLYRFNFVATDIEDDCRVIRKKDASEVLYIEGFCPPIVETDILDKVHTDCEKRSKKALELRTAKKQSDGKQIRPLSQGLVLVYPLTGLVRCAKCNASMRPSKSGAKGPNAASYYYYRCPSSNDDRCDNKLYLRGPWLWEVVVARLRETLFPLARPSGKDFHNWLGELMAEVRTELIERLSHHQGRMPLLQAEIRQIDVKVAGWMESLSKTNLSALVRNQLEQQLGDALEQKQAIEIEAETLSASDKQVDELLSPAAAIERLQNLNEVLSAGSPSDINVELSLHIESIMVSPDGSVTMRTNRLGIFEGATQMLSVCRDLARMSTPGNHRADEFQVRPRALSRRSTTASIDASPLDKGSGLIESGDPNLPDKWVDEAIFQMPELTCWSQENAAEVAELRKKGQTHQQLADYFGKTVPTIRKALKFAAKVDGALGELPRKMPRSSWAREHATEVAAKRTTGMSVLDLAAEYGKSDTTIRHALNLAEQHAGQ